MQEADLRSVRSSDGLVNQSIRQSIRFSRLLLKARTARWGTAQSQLESIDPFSVFAW